MQTPDDDSPLVEAVRRNDERATEQLYRKHASKVYTYALRSTKNTDVAEEVTQETFIRAFRSISSFRGRAKFRTWLLSIAVNQVRTYARKPNCTQPLEEPDMIGGDVRAPTQPLLKKRLNEALSELPAGYRDVVVMHDVLGMAHEEIAEARRCTVGTSKSQLHKARAKLRELLKGMEGHFNAV